MSPTDFSHDPADWIRRLPHYADLGAREQNILAAICDVAQHSTGDIIIDQGDRPAYIPLLVKGHVRTGYRDDKNNFVDFTNLQAPDLLGFLWFMDPGIRCPLVFEATSTCICLNLRSMDLENLHRSGNALSFPILAFLYRRSAEQFRMFNDVYREFYEKPQDTYMRIVELMS